MKKKTEAKPEPRTQTSSSDALRNEVRDILAMPGWGTAAAEEPKSSRADILNPPPWCGQLFLAVLAASDLGV